MFVFTFYNVINNFKVFDIRQICTCKGGKLSAVLECLIFKLKDLFRQYEREREKEKERWWYICVVLYSDTASATSRHFYRETEKGT